MKDQIKQLGRDSFVYGMGDALKRMVVFLLLPVYTRYLTPSDYGQLELLGITLTILFIVTSQGMGTAFFRFYGFTQTDFQKSELIGTAHYYLIISSFIVCGFLYAFSKPFSNLLFETKLNASYIKSLFDCIEQNYNH